MDISSPRRHATDCLRRAQIAKTVDEKALLISMADAWLSLAHAEELCDGQAGKKEPTLDKPH